MKKILWISESLSHYRIPLFKDLSNYVNLTIIHNSEIKNNNFSQKKLFTQSFWKFKWYKNINLKDYDVIIFPFDLKVLNLYTFWKYKNIRAGVFGIGVRASYDNNYDSSYLDSLIRSSILKKIDFGIFYDSYPKIKYTGMRVDPNKLFVAPNTIYCDQKFNLETKIYSNILFVGSLYKQKNVFQLIEAYKILKDKNIKLPILDIIGDGPDRKKISLFISNNHLNDKIQLHGEIIDEKELRKFYNNSCVVISPSQAGLSVLQSFSYATGFITSEYAKTGGEKFNIIEGVNGDVFDGSTLHLSKIIQKYCNPTYAKNIGINAHKYYNLLRNKELWIKRVLKAINL